jgi:hypothetical protein
MTTGKTNQCNDNENNFIIYNSLWLHYLENKTVLTDRSLLVAKHWTRMIFFWSVKPVSIKLIYQIRTYNVLTVIFLQISSMHFYLWVWTSWIAWTYSKSLISFLRKLSCCVLETIWWVLIFRAKTCRLTMHRPRKDKLSNTKYNKNLPKCSDTNKVQIHSWIHAYIQTDRWHKVKLSW